MVYRSLSDLSNLVRENIYKVPHDIDLVVGIPRSGMLPAMMIALYLNKKVTDLESFIEGRVFEAGERTRYIQEQQFRKVLIVDDSVCSGNAIKKAKQKLQSVADKYELIFLAPIIRSEGKDLVDIYFEIIDDARIFEWNLMHHSYLQTACVDIDGVLNVDPKVDDDGPLYREFLKNAAPLFVPTAPIGALVSCRLEKYRTLTEEWLEKYHIQYGTLVMLPFATKSERVAWGKHGEYKAEYYKSREDLDLFIESSKEQARIIADISQKPVICIETNTLMIPNSPKVSFFKRVKRYIRKHYPQVYTTNQKLFKK